MRNISVEQGTIKENISCYYDVLIVGGGAAGMAAAAALSKSGEKKIALAERNEYLGGVLPQCIHNGFGLGYFKEDMTGPEYANRFIQKLDPDKVDILTGTMVLELGKDKTALLSSKNGLKLIGFDKCILATGAREKSIGSLDIGGTRPAGIFTAGQAQYLINIGHHDIGNSVVILGSGDIGQIMARRIRILGKNICQIVEISDKLGGISRNQKECIEAFDIPVAFNSTITMIHGDKRICGVTIKNMIDGSTRYVKCDTLLTAVGLLPEQELLSNLETDGILPDWISVCGNSDYIHEIVDSVSFQAESIAAKL